MKRLKTQYQVDKLKFYHNCLFVYYCFFINLVASFGEPDAKKGMFTQKFF